MSVTKETVLATAALCRLDLSSPSAGTPEETAEERLSRLASELDAVVKYMAMLNQIDTSGVEPLYSPLPEPGQPRADMAEKRRSTEEILKNAPQRQQSFFAVPPVI